MLGDDAAVGGARHGRQHGGEAGIAAEDLQHQEALVRAGRGAQAVGHLDGARDAGAEADAVVGAGHVVVHRLGNGDDLDAFLVQAHAVAERVVAADRDEVVDAQPFEVLQHLRRQVVALGVVLVLQVRRARLDFFTLPGLVREVCRKVPPVRPARLTISSVKV